VLLSPRVDDTWLSSKQKSKSYMLPFHDSIVWLRDT